MARDLFTGWGQSKVVEDVLNRLRDRETRAVKDKRLGVVNQWNTMRGEEIIKLHRRVELDPAPLEKRKKLDRSIFVPKHHTPSIDVDSITGRATWATFTPQTIQALSADRQLFLFCRRNACWERAGDSWRTSFVPKGTVLTRAGADDARLVLGVVGYISILTWPLDKRITKEGNTYYALSSAIGKAEASWGFVLDFDSWQVIPSKLVSPLHRFLLDKKRFSGISGLVLHQSSPPCSILENAARHAFWKMSQSQLQKLAKDQDVVPPTPDLLALVTTLVKKCIKDVPEEQLDAILALRGHHDDEDLAEQIPHEVLEQALPKEDVKTVEDMRERTNTVNSLA